MLVSSVSLLSCVVVVCLHKQQQLQALEHQNERFALEAHHREEEERRRQAVAAMTPASPWHGTPPSLQMDPEWQVCVCWVFAGQLLPCT